MDVDGTTQPAAAAAAVQATTLTTSTPASTSNAPVAVTSSTSTAAPNAVAATAVTAAAPPVPAACCANVVTIPVPIVSNEDYYTYVTVKGSLHDRSCSIFGLNETETQALSKRFENSVKPAVNGIMVNVPPMVMVNTLAQLSYKVVCSCGEAEICWTMQREI